MTGYADIPRKCPICGGKLEVDEEYMLSEMGPAYTFMPWQDWTFACMNEDECGEAGYYEDLVKMAQCQRERNNAAE